MMRGRIARLIVRLGSPWRQGASRAAALCVTIRGRILVAFLVMCVITAALGAYATMGVRNAGLLVDKTFDESLMSINYARAAATDFAAMRAAFARRWIATDSDMRAALDDEFDKLGTSLSEDLAIAAQRSQSVRATRAAESVKRAVDAWRGICERLLDGTKLDVNWATLDQYTVKVDDQIDLLVNYTAGDGFLYRQSARAAVAHDIQLNIAGIALALLLSALVAWALARRIVGPVAVASNVAARIAAGKLDVAIPKGSGDELGALLTAMGVMRDNIKAMMDREVDAAPFRAGAACRRAGKFPGRRRGGGCQRRHRARQRPGRGFPRRIAEPAQARHAARAAATGLAGDRRRRPRPDGASRQSQRHQRSLDAGRALAAHQPQPDPRPGLHRAVQRHQPPEGAGIVAARDQPAARRRAREHDAGPVPLRRAEPARSLQPALSGNLRAAARPDQAGHQLQGDSGDQRRLQQSSGQDRR